MHLDERLEKSREVLGKQLAAGQQKVSNAYNRMWAEMEAMREAQRKRHEEARAAGEKEGKAPGGEGRCKFFLANAVFPFSISLLLNHLVTSGSRKYN